MMEISTTKSEIRKRCLEARRAMAPQDAAAKSHAIAQRLESLPVFAEAVGVLCYVASKDNEVDTRGLIGARLERGIAVLVPIAEAEGRMAWSQLRALDELAPGRFGILEPRPECRRIVTPPPEAPVIVPGIAFSPEGHRVGYGGGYYDRFLDAPRGPAIGLAYEIQIVAPWKTATHDIPVDFVVTETQTIKCLTI